MHKNKHRERCCDSMNSKAALSEYALSMTIAFHLDRRERDSSHSDGSTTADLARMTAPHKINCARRRRFHIQADMAVVLVNVAQAKQGILDLLTCFVAWAYFAA
ncbi:hypothetical protein DXT89_00420 [Agrobacterium vitis]|uniref:Uncharacterized protein n=1 Tax=Agrobacterium vitis TaxID=373 RepID=A0A368NXX9_AGRVI|nr:hypothetical protein DXM22_03315 [Agrobacterium vitis]KAA3531887.1 hypothetical protein DXT89_00420 [Agrobacterium vitis]RCU55016.1 hypothetical protein ASB66_008565 [Agrobacterium vitis]